MENQSEKGKKVSKTNRHFEIYLEYVKIHSVLKLKWTMQRSYSAQIQNIWENMTKELNSSGGPVRDVTHWKKVFTEWKSHIRRKLKYNKPLNDPEKQLVELTGLTSIPERRVKCNKLVNEKTIIDNDNRNKYAKENVTIKEEVEDSSEESSKNLVEPEPAPCNNVEISSKKKRKIIIEEIPRGNNAQKEQNVNLSNAQIRTQPINEGSKGACQTQSLDRSTQVDQVMLGESRATDLASIGASLQSLSNADNNNRNKYAKKNVTIKEEVEDSSEESPKNLVEPEPAPCSVEISSKKKRKIIIEEIPRANNAQKEQNVNLSNAQIRTQPINEGSKGACQTQSLDRSTQVDQVMDNNNRNKYAKKNVTIKEEVEDSSEESPKNLVEPEPAPCSVEISSKKKRKIIIEEIPRANNAQKEQNVNLSNAQIRTKAINEGSKGACQTQSLDRSTQVDQVMLRVAEFI